jgi:hypothetical protein
VLVRGLKRGRKRPHEKPLCNVCWSAPNNSILRRSAKKLSENPFIDWDCSPLFIYLFIFCG